MTIGNAGLMGLSRDRMFDVSGRNLRGATGGGANYIVAASNASRRVRAQADYVCDGIRDEEEINAALAQIGSYGGKIALSEGLFTISSKILISKHNVHLCGAGAGEPNSSGQIGGTRINLAAGFSDTEALRVANGITSMSCITLDDFSINGASQTSPAVNGIFFQCKRSVVSHVRVKKMSGHGFIGDGHTVSPGGFDCFIDYLYCDNNAGDSVQCNNYFTDNLFSNCILSRSVGHGISIDANGAGNQFVGCYIWSCTGAGSRAVNCLAPWQLKFIGNRLQDCNGGIYLSSATSFAAFLIVGNSIRNCSIATDNTTDGININFTVDSANGGLISGNSFCTDLGLDNPSYNRMRYGINVVTPLMNNLVIGPNSAAKAASALSVFGTGEMSDSGTSTKGQFYGVGQGTAPLSTVSIAFTDGDTVRRTRVYDSLVTSTSKISCTVRRPNDASLDFDLTASFERGTQGATVSASDGGSITAWDAVTTQLVGGTTYPIYDGAHVLRINGALSVKMQTSAGIAYATWETPHLGNPSNHYGRAYLYLEATPASSTRLIQGKKSSVAAFVIGLTGTTTLMFIRDSVGVQGNFSTPIPLNKFVRVEWRVINSATVGQIEVKLFLQPFSSTVTETVTTAASLNTLANLDQIDFGIVNAVTAGPFWFDDIAISFTGYPGPSQAPVDANDLGYIYHANVVRVGNGYFDALVTATDEGLEDVSEIAPNETVQLTYSIGS